jgi:hypothetical protein
MWEFEEDGWVVAERVCKLFQEVLLRFMSERIVSGLSRNKHREKLILLRTTAHNNGVRAKKRTALLRCSRFQMDGLSQLRFLK